MKKRRRLTARQATSSLRGMARRPLVLTLVVVAAGVALAGAALRGTAPAETAGPPSPVPAQRAPADTAALSPFARAKAERLLRDRLPCLGCHTLDGEGGKIGPDLSAVGARRSTEYIRAVVQDPQGTVLGTPMPRVLVPPSTLDLVVAYLASRRDAAAAAPAAVPADSRAGLYATYCAACHGADGNGDGPNASYLPVPPTRHADSASMARRSDAALYDAIAAGGYVMNRSHRMPPFGATLTPAEIRALVRQLRALCRCEGPEWSRDGASR